MNVDTTKNLTCAFCTTDGGTTITVEKCRYAAECFSTKLETDNRARIGFETWGDNSAKGDIKVDNKTQGAKVQSERKPLNELPASCRQVFKALSEDGSFTQQALIRKLNLSRAAIAKAIAVLIRERYIIRRGARKNGYWEVLDR